MTGDAAESGLLLLQSAQISDVGGRASNQDALRSVQQGALACYVVADGAGGHAGGETASSLATEGLAAAFAAGPEFSAAALRYWVDTANAQIGHAQLAQPGLHDMSSTVAALLIDRRQGAALWAHLGDTRIYFFRQRKILAMSKDHSLVQQFIDAGYCSSEQSRTHPQRNVLFAALGAADDTPPEVTEHSVPVQHGDAFLLCTDGLWEWVLEHEMEAELANAASAAAWLEGMQAVANRRFAQSGAIRDNTTAFAVWISAAAP
ncbi:PP2C family protein-serine/threonine phosphatase [Undibacterium sp.]|uniref:PP2C family protein-serine/threonine phosphatase n=1 Tax=Undibacterium sp. TaxID=1914977 RepID=UPI002C3D48E9|nr:protein phosphatase 2C domain-containing protein [Undibacterium sp.]HTD04602.1 protein phosphatase 2C domain-containing protein [Undibacterium sp.]